MQRVPCYFFSTSHRRYPQSEPNKQNDRSHSNEKTHVCKVAGGKMKKLPCINVFRFCARNMRVSLLEQTKMYGPSPLVLNMLISYLFPRAWDGSYRGITEMRAGRGNLQAKMFMEERGTVSLGRCEFVERSRQKWIQGCKLQARDCGVAIQRASSLFLTRFTSSSVRELGGSSAPPCEGVTHGRLWLFPSWLLHQNFARSVGKFTASSPRWNAEGATSCSSTVLTLVNLPDGDDALGAGKADIAFISVSMAATIINHNFVSGPL